jgi:hypothetical protein
MFINYYMLFTIMFLSYLFGAVSAVVVLMLMKLMRKT